MQRTRCVEDFATIRARMQELQREREQAAPKPNEALGSFGQRVRRDDPARTEVGREELFRGPRRLG